MDKSNIVSSHTIRGVRGCTPVGLVQTDSFTSTDEVLDDAVRIGNDLGADWIVGFNFQSQPTLHRSGRKWSGFGTAVKCPS